MKKFLITLLFLIPCLTAQGATTWYFCTANGNWSSTSAWTSVLADQGTCVASLGAPAAGDTAVLNGNSGNVALDSASADVAATVNMTGYDSTLTLTTADNLIVSGGTVTLGGTITGTGTLKVTGTETLVSSGITWPGALNLAVAGTVTLSDSGNTWTNTGLVTYSAATILNKTITGDTLTANGGLTMTSGTGISPTAIIILGGGTWSGSGLLSNSLTLAGNDTVSGLVDYNTGTLTYSSGTITTTGSTLYLLGGTITTNGMTWNIISDDFGSATWTLGSNLQMKTLESNDGTLTFSGAYNTTTAIFQSLSFGNSITKIVSGQTLNITSGIHLSSGVDVSDVVTIQSVTASSPAYINYTGPISGEVISGGTVFTDIYASAPPVPFYGQKLLNIAGGLLTRTSGIVNVTAANIGKRAIMGYNGV